MCPINFEAAETEYNRQYDPHELECPNCGCTDFDNLGESLACWECNEVINIE